MSELCQLASRLILDEVEARFRCCRDDTERSHGQVIWLRAQGRTTSEVAAVTGYEVDWVRRLVRRYNATGSDSLGDRRRGNPCQPPVLDKAGQTASREALQGRAPDGGLWSGPEVARWITNKTGHRLSKKGGWLYLKRLGMTAQPPRRRHPQAASPAEEASFKNTSAKSWIASDATPSGRGSSCGPRMKLA